MDSCCETPLWESLRANPTKLVLHPHRHICRGESRAKPVGPRCRMTSDFPPVVGNCGIFGLAQRPNHTIYAIPTSEAGDSSEIDKSDCRFALFGAILAGAESSKSVRCNHRTQTEVKMDSRSARGQPRRRDDCVGREELVF
jgi:hypothetical protein